MINNAKNSINKIAHLNETFVSDNKPVFEIIIKQDSKILFRNKTYAGVLCVVNGDIKFGVDLGGTIEADKQVFGFGHPALQVFCFDMLRIQLLPKLKDSVISFFKNKLG